MTEYYKIEHLSYLDEHELVELIKSSWNLDKNGPIEVIAELRAKKISEGYYHYRIYNVKSSKTLEYLQYPISNIKEENDIQYNGIYSPLRFNEAIKKYIENHSSILISCQLELSEEKERLKHNNPMLLKVISSSIQVCKNIDETLVVRDDNGILVTESIINSIEFAYKTKFTNLTKKYEKEYQKTIKDLQNNIQDNQNKLKKLQNYYISQEKKLQKEIDKKDKSLKRLEKNISLIKNEITEKKREKTKLITLIDELKSDLERMEETMAKKLEKFRSFMKEKADQLLKLDFIDQEEYDNLLMIKNKQEGQELKIITFRDDLNSDCQKAISHIQSYLFNQDIIYPRYIIEDFMALIQTNDLIILAGESGSGKTNLVKSFAKAIGGKSCIIPVKPNWTSAEDLLGYYNPLEKKYLTTPFLESLLEAKNNPDTPYFICLDEMNLARVEYYFADFLSLLEERDKMPKIQLYSDDESSHVLSEFKNVLEIINSVKEKYQKNNLVDFISILKDKEVNSELKRIFGFSDKDSLIKYHTDLRKMISGIINTPSSIEFPKNVRIIGAINIDETTHYLSPKILDRTHIMKFDSPLLYDWTAISNELEDNDKKDHIIKFELDDLGTRLPYPSYDKNDPFCQTITSFTKDYFQPLGIEVGLRTIRQGLNYQNIFKKQGSDENLVLNNFILHKILPKMTFDSKKKTDKNRSKEDLLLEFQKTLEKHIDEKLINSQGINVIEELKEMISASKSNDGIVNYWA